MHPAAGDPASDAGVHAGAERLGHVCAHTHLHAVSSQEGRHGKTTQDPEKADLVHQIKMTNAMCVQELAPSEEVDLIVESILGALLRTILEITNRPQPAGSTLRPQVQDVTVRNTARECVIKSET